MMKKLIKAGVLLIIFVAALIVSSLVINRGSGDQIVDMGAPTLPRVWFTLNGEKVNVLSGYDFSSHVCVSDAQRFSVPDAPAPSVMDPPRYTTETSSLFSSLFFRYSSICPTSSLFIFIRQNHRE